MDTIIFNIEKMNKLRQQDRLINFMYNNLSGLAHSKKLEMLFNSEVLNDSAMTELYKKL